jgi:hypothetical protein
MMPVSTSRRQARWKPKSGSARLMIQRLRSVHFDSRSSSETARSALHAKGAVVRTVAREVDLEFAAQGVRLRPVAVQERPVVGRQGVEVVDERRAVAGLLQATAAEQALYDLAQRELVLAEDDGVEGGAVEDHVVWQGAGVVAAGDDRRVREVVAQEAGEGHHAHVVEAGVAAHADEQQLAQIADRGEQLVVIAAFVVEVQDLDPDPGVLSDVAAHADEVRQAEVHVGPLQDPRRDQEDGRIGAHLGPAGFSGRCCGTRAGSPSRASGFRASQTRGSGAVCEPKVAKALSLHPPWQDRS